MAYRVRVLLKHDSGMDTFFSHSNGASLVEAFRSYLDTGSPKYIEGFKTSKTGNPHNPRHVVISLKDVIALQVGEE